MGKLAPWKPHLPCHRTCSGISIISTFEGSATIAADRDMPDWHGITLADALGECGVEVERVEDATRVQADAAACLELHIEQGRVTERFGLPLGVVLGTTGVERWSIIFSSRQEAHSGSTPVAVRRDTLAAEAKLALEIRPIARRHPDDVATMGSLKTFPGIVTAVVARCLGGTRPAL